MDAKQQKDLNIRQTVKRDFINRYGATQDKMIVALIPFPDGVEPAGFHLQVNVTLTYQQFDLMQSMLPKTDGENHSDAA